MSSTKARVAAGSDRIGRQEADCWQIEQIGPPSQGAVGRRSVQQRSRAMSRWLDRLHDRPGFPVYRVCPASEDE